jgi:hypothetical protein
MIGKQTKNVTSTLTLTSKYPEVEQHFHGKFMVSVKIFGSVVRRALGAELFYYQPIELPLGMVTQNNLIIDLLSQIT